jgi:peptidoglycan/xylan/chitin deacetylase (PgdA/CDA1 family)
VARRVLLSLGGLLVLSACEPQAHSSAAATPTTKPTAVPAGKHPVPAATPGTHAVPLSADSTTTDSTVTTGTVATKPEYYVHKGPHAIALTIDDGPDPRYTPQILALLRHYSITATFCQVGGLIQAHPALVRAVAGEGHLIANHTWTHADLARARPAAVHDEIARTTDVLERVSGRRPTLFRAPYGAWSRATFAECARQGLRPLGWSVDPRDWSRPGVDHITGNILAHTRTGSIILEHDGGGNRTETVAALRIVIPRLLHAGYHFVTP